MGCPHRRSRPFPPLLTPPTPPTYVTKSPLGIYLGQCIARRRTRRRRRASMGPQRRPACRNVRKEPAPPEPAVELASAPGGAACPARAGGRSGAPGKTKGTDRPAPAPGRRTCLLGRAAWPATQSSVIDRQTPRACKAEGMARPSAWLRKAGCPRPCSVDERAGQGEHGYRGGLRGACWAAEDVLVRRLARTSPRLLPRAGGAPRGGSPGCVRRCAAGRRPRPCGRTGAARPACDGRPRSTKHVAAEAICACLHE